MFSVGSATEYRFCKAMDSLGTCICRHRRRRSVCYLGHRRTQGVLARGYLAAAISSSPSATLYTESTIFIRQTQPTTSCPSRATTKPVSHNSKNHTHNDERGMFLMRLSVPPNPEPYNCQHFPSTCPLTSIPGAPIAMHGTQLIFPSSLSVRGIYSSERQKPGPCRTKTFAARPSLLGSASKLSVMMVCVLCEFVEATKCMLTGLSNRDGYVYEGQ